ncbi:hypothetical protein AAHH71_01645 [Bacillus toyonensis]|nr:transposase for insertion sequence element IS231 [Bacillus cereus Rock3-28]
MTYFLNMHQRQELSLFAEESYRYMFFVISNQLATEVGIWK